MGLLRFTGSLATGCFADHAADSIAGVALAPLGIVVGESAPRFVCAAMLFPSAFPAALGTIQPYFRHKVWAMIFAGQLAQFLAVRFKRLLHFIVPRHDITRLM
jgi:hypothetical protein